MLAIALTIAGSDPSGGAGIQADLKTFHQFGVYGQAAITLLTVQNTRTVSRVEVLPPELVLQQIDAVLDDMPPQAAKTGALGSPEVVKAVAKRAETFSFPLVIDPVMISKHGAPLIAEEARAALLHELAPRAFLITPNLHELASLASMSIEHKDDIARAVELLRAQGLRNIYVKGGHALPGDDEQSTDYLYLEDGAVGTFATARIDTPHTHGTGCTLSAAITAALASGNPLTAAVVRAKSFIGEAIRTAPGLGHGQGPVNHFAAVPALE
jgi:hydroxymethylpyrimidine/phosphomethylpyrimidine kinase